MSCDCSSIRHNGVCESKTLIETQQGDSFPLYIYYYGGANGEASVLPKGLDLFAALYDYNGKLIAAYTTADRTIKLGFGYYKIEVSHEVSMRLTGTAMLELTILSESGFVDHASDIITIDLAQRKNNDYIKGGSQGSGDITPIIWANPITDEYINEICK